MTTIVVTGSRDWTDARFIMKILMMEPDGTTIIHGGAKGADTIAKHTARALGFTELEVPADWKKHGKAAGPIRNREMLDMKPDKVIAFCLNNSHGTMDCVKEAERRGIYVVFFNERAKL